MNTNETCNECSSSHTYLSGAGYNSVLVCKDCNHEEHMPSEDSIKILLDKLTIIR